MPISAWGPLEVSLVGDFDGQSVLPTAQEYLGAMAQRRPAASQAPKAWPLSFPAGQTASISLDSRIEKGVVRVAFATDDFWDIMQTRRLSLLAQVFSERLRKQVREKLGASYSPYVYNDASLACKEYGVMQAVVNTDSSSFDLVVTQVKKIAADLCENGVTEAELELVKAPVMNQLQVLRQDNKYWLGSVLSDVFRHPEKLDWANTLVSGYGSITAAQLSTLARRYLKNEAVIIIRPENGS